MPVCVLAWTSVSMDAGCEAPRRWHITEGSCSPASTLRPNATCWRGWTQGQADQQTDRHQEDREGYETLLRALGAPPVLVAVEATGHYWKNLFARDRGRAPGRAAQPTARPAPPGCQSRTHQDGRDQRHRLRASGIREAARTNPAARRGVRGSARAGPPSRPAAEDFDDRVRQLHRLVDLGFPESTRYVRSLDSMLATCLLAEYPTAHAFARATPRRLADSLQNATWSATNSPDNSSRPPSVGRPPPGTGLHPAGAPHLPGSGSVATPPRRDRA